MNLDFSVGREFKHDILLQVSYVGRALASHADGGRICRSPRIWWIRRPECRSIRPPTILSKQAVAKVPTAQVQNVPFWQNCWPGACRKRTSAPTQAIYNLYLSRTTQAGMNTEQQLDVLPAPLRAVSSALTRCSTRNIPRGCTEVHRKRELQRHAGDHSETLQRWSFSSI